MEPHWVPGGALMRDLPDLLRPSTNLQDQSSRHPCSTQEAMKAQGGLATCPKPQSQKRQGQDLNPGLCD